MCGGDLVSMSVAQRDTEITRLRAALQQILDTAEGRRFYEEQEEQGCFTALGVVGDIARTALQFDPARAALGALGAAEGSKSDE